VPSCFCGKSAKKALISAKINLCWTTVGSGLKEIGVSHGVFQRSSLVKKMFLWFGMELKGCGRGFKRFMEFSKGA
jgi:hypothetical protein